MPELDFLDPSARSSFIHRVRLLILGRMGLICFILAASWLWSYSYLDTSNALPLHLFRLLVASSVLTGVYILLLGFEIQLKWQIRAQVLLDAVRITWFVAETGALISPYITLYIFLISASGFFLRPNSVYAISFACVISFTILALLSSPAEAVQINGEFPVSGTLQQIAFHDAAFLLVGVLAARLAGRRRMTVELRKAEEDFADLNVLHTRILASIRSGIVTTDLEGRIYSFNRAAEEMTGQSGAAVVGRSIFAVFGEELRPHFEISMGRARSDEFTRAHFELGIKSGNNGSGHSVRIACTVSSLVGRSGGITGLILAFQDTTELHEMEETLRRSDRLAAVGRLSAGLAHEIRNPLGSMSSALQFLSTRVPPDTEDAELMGVVMRESDRLNQIITDFLTYARPQPQGQLNGARPDRIDVGAAIKDCLALLRHDPTVTASYSFDLDIPDAPVMVRANDSEIKQIFWNLLQNSVRAMKQGGRISVKLKDVTVKHVKVVVADTGCGMDDETIKRIFEPFQSGSGGTGLGLSIVHKIVTELGGSIDVESKPDKGTRFTLELLK
jgi:two-component system sensor histidine kinase PilS (NtrC family)